ncbi:hypothetical protein [Isoptericola croceus]|uniref:hypothetical protein n=1 Tax=Isoptericola croceus TaxID=3031406 RepID=UPI0023F75602|nr:hypothetical protein [Isoptericola croceus]
MSVLASAAVEWLLGRRDADAVLDILRGPEVSLYAPYLSPVEFMAAVRGLVFGGHATAERGRLALGVQSPHMRP